MKRIEILGVLVNPVSLKNAASLVEKWVNSNKQYQITTPNPEQIVLAQKNEEFKKALNSADLSIPDGIGIVLAARFLNIKNKILKIKNTLLRFSKKNFEGQANERSKIPDTRVSGIDLMIELCKLAAKKGWRVFLLGGKNGVAESAAKILNTKYKILNTDYYSGSQDIKNETPLRPGVHRDYVRGTADRFKIDYFEGAENIKEETKWEKQETIKRINNFRPHLLFVVYGAPYQELWIAKNLPKLKVKVAMGVGGAFDYISGRVPRAPKWMRDLGLEWLYRLIREPWRIKRQLKLLKFVWLVIAEWLNG